MSRQPFLFTTYCTVWKGGARVVWGRPDHYETHQRTGRTVSEARRGAASFPLSEWDSGDGTGENKVCLAVGEITPVTYATAAVDSMTHTARTYMYTHCHGYHEFAGHSTIAYSCASI
jgi:hypothetical protein